VKETGSELINSSFDNLKKKMKIELSSFAGHTTNTKIVSPFNPKAVYVNGNKITTGLSTEKADDIYMLSIDSIQKTVSEIIEIEF
jgi:hypothetical protein